MAWHRLGEQVKALRVNRGLTRKALAEQLNLSEVFIKKVEAGERLPSLPNLDRIARALGATLNVELVERSSSRRRRG